MYLLFSDSFKGQPKALTSKKLVERETTDHYT